MPVRGSTKRYAQAVFDIAKATNSLDKWRDDLRDLAEAVANGQLAAFLENPRVPDVAKQNVLKQVIPAIGPGALSLAMLLIAKARLVAAAKGIADDFEAKLDQHRGIVRATVSTAVALDDAQQKQIAAQLQSAIGKQIKLEARVDAAIVGGAVIRVGDRVLDGSVRTRLEGLRRSLQDRSA